MHELLYEGANILATKSSRPNRRTSYSILIAYDGHTVVSIDSHLPNRLVSKAFSLGWNFCDSELISVRSEPPYLSSRLDFLAEMDNGHTLVEIKSVTLVNNGFGLFPDAPSERGARQINDIISGINAGLGGAVVFIIQRNDAEAFKPNDIMDASFGQSLRTLADAGGCVRAYGCEITCTDIYLANEIKVVL
jgi:sugar fermentation stimulation protein A